MKQLLQQYGEYIYHLAYLYVVTLTDDQLLVQATDHRAGQVEVIDKGQVLGKVVGVQKLPPTFTLAGKEAEIYAAFKENHDVTQLVGLDPVTMLRMYYTATMERDMDTIYTLRPAFTSLHNVNRQQFPKVLFANELTLSDEVKHSIYASSYNGLEDGTFQLSSTKVEAIVSYTTHNNYWGNPISVTMIKNKYGFWEIK